MRYYTVTVYGLRGGQCAADVFLILVSCNHEQLSNVKIDIAKVAIIKSYQKNVAVFYLCDI
eukprot:XP_001708653.1 Hypothetical protein GL50803_114974 [Giardia lamblia ATCC 50803]